MYLYSYIVFSVLNYYFKLLFSIAHFPLAAYTLRCEINFPLQRYPIQLHTNWVHPRRNPCRFILIRRDPHWCNIRLISIYMISNSLGRTSIHSRYRGTHKYIYMYIWSLIYIILILSYMNMYFYDKFENTPENPVQYRRINCTLYTRFTRHVCLCAHIIPYYNTLIGPKLLYTCRYT